VRTIRIYSPALVLAVWAAAWALGATSDAVIVLGLAATCVAVVLHCLELFGHHGP